jgi:hypothetical protein
MASGVQVNRDRCLYTSQVARFKFRDYFLLLVPAIRHTISDHLSKKPEFARSKKISSRRNSISRTSRTNVPDYTSRGGSHPKTIRVPFWPIRRPIQIKAPQYLRQKPTHLHGRYVLSDAGTNAVAELHQVSQFRASNTQRRLHCSP